MSVDDSKKVDCFICSKNNSELIHKSKSLDGELCVSICRNDGLVYLSPRWSNDMYELYYKKNYDTTYRPALDKSQAEKDKYATSIQIYNRLGKFGKNSFHRMLDVGSGMGYALDYFSKIMGDALHLYAIEASDTCLKHLQSHGKINIVSRDVESNWEDDYKNQFDFILMRHVVEHFLDPVAVLKKVAKVLSDDGILYIAVPNMMKPKMPLEGYWFRPAHTYYFSPETLRHCAALAGLKNLVLEESDDSEIWGVFSKTEEISPRFQSVYKQQMAVLEKNIKIMSGKNRSFKVLKNKILSFVKGKI